MGRDNRINDGRSSFLERSPLLIVGALLVSAAAVTTNLSQQLSGSLARKMSFTGLFFSPLLILFLLVLIASMRSGKDRAILAMILMSVLLKLIAHFGWVSSGWLVGWQMALTLVWFAVFVIAGYCGYLVLRAKGDSARVGRARDSQN